MAVERLNPSDGSWTRHSLHAHQCHYDMLRHGYVTGSQCPWDPCRTQSTQYAHSLYTQPKPDNLAKLTPLGQRAEYEKKAAAHRVSEIREDAYSSVLRTRGDRGIDDYGNAPAHVDAHAPSPKSTMKALEKETVKTVKDEYHSAEAITRTSYQEMRELYGMASHELQNAGLGSHDTVNQAINSTVRDITKPQNSLLGSSVLAASSLVATVATVNLTALRSDIYVAECKSLGKALGVGFEVDKVTTTINTATSFGAYMSSVQDSKAYERVARQDAEIIRDRKIADANAQIQDAHTRYDSQVALFTASRDKEAEKFTRNMRSLDEQQRQIESSPAIQKINERRQEKLDNANTTYSNKRATIEADKERALAKIDPSTPIAAAQRREVSATYDKRLSNLEFNHKRDIANINTNHDQQIAHKMAGASQKLAELSNARQMLTEKHATAQADFQSRVQGAQAERDAKILAANKDANKAREDFKTEKKSLRKEAKARSEDIKQIAVGNYHDNRAAKTNLGIARTAALVGGGTKNAQQLKSILVSNQMQLSEYMVQNFGSDAEKQIIDAFFADKKKQNLVGAPSQLSKADRQAAEEILAKYGFSDMTNAKGIDEAVKILKNNMPALKELAQKDKDALNVANMKLKDLQTDRKDLLAAAGGAKNLTPAQQKKLAEIDESIKAAKKEQKKLKDAAGKSSKAVATAKSQIKQMNRFKGVLPKMGKNIKQNAKQVIKQYSATARRVSLSLGGALITLSRIVPTKASAIEQADRRFKQQVSEVMKYTNFAVNSVQRMSRVSLQATKMVLGVGKWAGKGIKIIASKSPLHTAVMNKLFAFAERHTFLARGALFAKNGIGFVGGGIGKLGKAGMKLGKGVTRTALRAPGAILKLASTSITDLPDMATKAMATGIVHMGVAAVGLGSRTAIKAGVKVGRVPVKYTLKAGKAVGKFAGKQAVRVGKFAGKKALGAGVRVGKAVGRGAARVFNKTIGKTALWKNAQKAGRAVAKTAKKVGQTVAKAAAKLLKPLAAIGSKIVALVSWLASAIASACVVVAGAISSLICGLLYGMIGIALLVILLVMLMSVLDALFEFIGQFMASNQIKISEDPSFIMNLGSNYRNVEISILEFFSKDSGYSNSEVYDDKIEVSDDPLYYAVFNNSFSFYGFCEDILNDAFPSAGIPIRKEGKDVNYRTIDGSRLVNSAAITQYESFIASKTDPTTTKTLKEILEAMMNSVWKLMQSALSALGIGQSETTFGDIDFNAENFYALVTTYDVAGATYYIGAKDDPKHKESDYEVSNAKDVMAMMDSIYTMDDTMTRTKVLRYLGVGEYQLSQVKIQDAKTKVAKQHSLDNLFWQTHEIHYSLGTEASQVRFHPTQSDGTLTTIAKSTISSADKPAYALRNILSATCDNYATVEGKSYEKQHTDGSSDCKIAVSDTYYYQKIIPREYNSYGGVSFRGTEKQNSQRHPRYSTVYWEVTSVSRTYNSTKKIYEPLVTLKCYCPDSALSSYKTTYSEKHGSSIRCTIQVRGYFTKSGNSPVWPSRGDLRTGTADINDHKISYYEYGYSYTPSPCPHKDWKPFTFDYCLGHIALQTDIYVSVANPVDPTTTVDLFTKVVGDGTATSPGLSAQTFDIGNGIWVWSRDLDVFAFDDLPAETINPQEEFSDSSLIALAQSKAQEPIEYFMESGGKITQMKTKHGKTNNQYLITTKGTNNGTVTASQPLFHVLYYLDNVYYQADLISIEQKDMEVYNKSWAPKKLSFKKSASGTTYPKFEDATT